MPADKYVYHTHEPFVWVETNKNDDPPTCVLGDDWPPEAWQWEDAYPSRFSPPWEDSSDDVDDYFWEVDDFYYDIEGKWKCIVRGHDLEDGLETATVYRCDWKGPPDNYYEKFWHLEYERVTWGLMRFIEETPSGISPIMIGASLLWRLFKRGH